MRRYFMLIPEAVHLVLQAAALAKGGDIFVLEMGEQIRILDLARNLIRLSGFVPEEDIVITFTGLRPGEKLSEELVGEDEVADSTSAEGILRVQLASPPELPVVISQVIKLERLAESGDDAALIRLHRHAVSRAGGDDAVELGLHPERDGLGGGGGGGSEQSRGDEGGAGRGPLEELHRDRHRASHRAGCVPR